MKNTKLTDHELIIKVLEEHDEYAELSLIERYRTKAFFIAYDYYYLHKDSGITIDEYVSVAFAAIHTAIRSFNLRKEAKFGHYYKKIAENAIKNYDAENSYLKKGKMFGGYISLDDSRYEGGMTYSEEFGDIDPNINKTIRDGELLDRLHSFKNPLTETEIRIYTLRDRGITFNGISKIMGIPLSTVYNIVRKINKTLLKTHK